jgi:monoamine oxidase
MRIMHEARIAIIGGGLSGLHAAWLLQQAGQRDYLLLEARSVLGGRISSCADEPASHASARFDLGATWFWPAIQPELARLVRDLGLADFEQYDEGDRLVEYASTQPPSRAPSYGHQPAAMRLRGGMEALTDALRNRLDAARLISGQRVHMLRAADEGLVLESKATHGEVATWRVEHAFLAVPPRLAESSIEFVPGLPAELSRSWRATPTWMAPHAKYVATYDTPFWRSQGLSGQAYSAHGPLAEIHDASAPDGDAALFGFFNVSADMRRRATDDTLKAHCRAQLVRLFGPQAASPTAEFIKDWAKDMYTATPADLRDAGGHAASPPSAATSGRWHGCLTGIASEWSPTFSGYVAGAIDASARGVQAWLASHTKTHREATS